MGTTSFLNASLQAKENIMDGQTCKFPGYIANYKNLSLICGLNKHTHFLTLFAYRIDANVHKIQNEICMEHILHEKTYNIILLAPKTLNINNLSCQICHHRQVFFNKELYFFLKVI